MRRSTFGRRPRRGQTFWRLLRVTVAVAAALFVVGYVYQVGLSAREAETRQIAAERSRLEKQTRELRDELTRLARRSQETERALEELRRRYAEDVPQGELARLVDVVAAQIEAGVEPERLAFLIRAAGWQRTCDGEPVTKRFVPTTPIAVGQGSYVRFDERIIITGEGASARNAAGLPEAWYDPAEPVRLEFRTLDGAVESVEGRLPLTHRMALDGKEYRFTAIPGEQSFIEVSAQACPFPGAGQGALSTGGT